MKQTAYTTNGYYAFGGLIPGRHTQTSAYRHGFNGKENDNEQLGDGHLQDYDLPALSRFFSPDPLTQKYPQLTPYQFASNTPIWAVDLDGLEGVTAQDGRDVSETVNEIFEISAKTRIDGTLIQTDDLPLISPHNNRQDNLGRFTNDGTAFIVSAGITENNFVNLILGAFITGEGPENYIFDQNSEVSLAMARSSIAQNAFNEFIKGNASEIANGQLPKTMSPWGILEQMSN